jgi:3-hydroxybutyryl-CoA dehydrogenase
MAASLADTVAGIKTVVVLGSGAMGAGIAQVLAQSGYSVIVRDTEERFLKKGKEGIEDSLSRLVKKGTISLSDKDGILSRLKLTTEFEKVKNGDFIIEAVTEDLEIKKEVFRQLDSLAKPEAVIATNTSSLSVTELALCTKRGGKVVGMHFFNPVPVMKLVEVVRTGLTSQETFQTTWDLAKKMGKEPIEAQDTPGFIFNRLIIPYLNEAFWAVYEGIGKVEDIDKAMKLGGNMPIGPLQLLDLVGLDVQLHACETLYREFGDPKFRPCPLNRFMVRMGYLGRKVKKGFYDYVADPPVPTIIDTGVKYRIGSH